MYLLGIKGKRSDFMLRAKDFRQIARDSLKGNWLVAVAAGFIATLLGGNLIGGSTFSIDIGEEIELSAEQLMREIALSPAIVNLLMGVIGAVAAFLAVYSIARMIIGGTVALGYAKFNLNLVNCNNPKIEDGLNSNQVQNRIKNGYVNYDTNMVHWYKFMTEQINSMVNYKIEF